MSLKDVFSADLPELWVPAMRGSKPEPTKMDKNQTQEAPRVGRNEHFKCHLSIFSTLAFCMAFAFSFVVGGGRKGDEKLQI